jgi:hypothetical protein
VPTCRAPSSAALTRSEEAEPKCQLAAFISPTKSMPPRHPFPIKVLQSRHFKTPLHRPLPSLPPDRLIITRPYKRSRGPSFCTHFHLVQFSSPLRAPNCRVPSSNSPSYQSITVGLTPSLRRPSKPLVSSALLPSPIFF